VDYAKLIKDTLAPLGIPRAETIYTGTKPVYIVFSEYFEGGAASAANKVVEREHSFMINIYQKFSDTSADINVLKEQTINLLETAGFNNVTAQNQTGLETVNGAIQYNRWLIDCSYTENLQQASQ
jgi:hypothetical protein